MQNQPANIQQETNQLFRAMLYELVQRYGINENDAIQNADQLAAGRTIAEYIHNGTHQAASQMRIYAGEVARTASK